MDLLLIVSILLAVTALFGVVNDRFLGLQSSIGLMLLALLCGYRAGHPEIRRGSSTTSAGRMPWFASWT